MQNSGLRVDLTCRVLAPHTTLKRRPAAGLPRGPFASELHCALAEAFKTINNIMSGQVSPKISAVNSIPFYLSIVGLILANTTVTLASFMSCIVLERKKI